MGLTRLGRPCHKTTADPVPTAAAVNQEQDRTGSTDTRHVRNEESKTPSSRRPSLRCPSRRHQRKLDRGHRVRAPGCRPRQCHRTCTPLCFPRRAVDLLDYLQRSSPKIQDLLWVALQVKGLRSSFQKGSIPIFSLLQQQDLKDNTLCRWVSRREDTQIWVMPLLIPKMGLLYGYSVGGYRYCDRDPFWVWVPK